MSVNTLSENCGPYLLCAASVSSGHILLFSRRVATLLMDQSGTFSIVFAKITILNKSVLYKVKQHMYFPLFLNRYLLSSLPLIILSSLFEKKALLISSSFLQGRVWKQPCEPFVVNAEFLAAERGSWVSSMHWSCGSQYRSTRVDCM